MTSPNFKKIEAVNGSCSSWKVVQSILCNNPSYKTHFYVGFKIKPLLITQHINSTAPGLCFSRSPALCLAPVPGPGPQFVFTDPGSQFVFTGPGPVFVFTGLGHQFVFTGPDPNLCLLALAPNLYLPALAYNFITTTWPEFPYTDLVYPICICIYGPGLRFVLPVRSLNLHLPYYW